MATARTNRSLEAKTPRAGVVVPICPPGQTPSSFSTNHPASSQQEPCHRDKLQALLGFLALHEQVRRKNILEIRRTGDDEKASAAELEEGEGFTRDEVLQLIAERAAAITGADGLAIALAENDEIVLQAAAGTVRPDLGARIDRDSAFSGACFRTGRVVSCDDTETDARVNLQACRRLGARSMVAVPLCRRSRGIGLLQAFSALPFGFDDSDVRKLNLLAELLLGALTPEDKDRFAESAAAAATKLEAAPSEPATVPYATDVRDEEPRKPVRRLVVLAWVVVALALTLEVWLKPKPGLLVNKIVRAEKKMVLRPMGTAAKGAAGAPPIGKPANPANINVGTISNGSRATNSPVNPRDLSKLAMVTGIQHWSSADSSTVVLSLEDRVQYEAHRISNPDRIYIDLHETQPASNLEGKSIDVGDALLKRIRVAQHADGMTRLVLRTKAKTDFTVSLETNPYRLVVEVRKAGTSAKAR